MKKTFFIIIGTIIFHNASAQQATLASTADTMQYTLGAFVGKWMVENDFTISNATLFFKGMEDMLQGREPAVADSTIAPIIAGYQLSVQNERNQQMEDQLFAELKGKPGVGVLPNGVHYLVIRQGDGIRPSANDSIVVNAVGVFPDGTLFEDTKKSNRPLRMVPSKLIPGLSEAVQMMPEGAVWRIFIPSTLGYGAVGLQNIIPPNMALVYEITLEKVIRNP